MLLQKIKDIMYQKLQGDYSFGPYGGVEGIDEAAADIEQLLQQTPCSTLRERLIQKVNKEKELISKVGIDTAEGEKCLKNIEAACLAILLIDNP